jgi:hypothetical protein
VRRAKLLAGVDPAALAAQPLAVEEMGAGELRTQPGTAQPLDRLAVQRVGGGAVAYQRPGARLDAKREVGAGRLGRLPKSLQRIACELCVSGARGCLDELGQRPGGDPRLEGVRGGLSGRRGRLLVATEPVAEDRGLPACDRRPDSLPPLLGLLDRGFDQRGSLGFPPLQGPEP